MRPDIAQAISTVIRFMSNLGRPHWETVKWILRYLWGSTNMKLCFGGSEPNLITYSDSDLDGDINEIKSTSSGGSSMSKHVANVCGFKHNSSRVHRRNKHVKRAIVAKTIGL
jgi:hypothetical protein